MKYCPSCQTRYADDTLQFCLQDGTELKSVTDGDSATSAPTIAFSEPETETVVKSREPQPWQPSQATHTPPPIVERKSRTLPVVLTTALMMLLLFGAGGVGAWLYLKNKNEIARDTNKNQPKNQNSPLNKTAAAPSPTASPSPTATPDDEEEDNSANTRETPTPNANPGEIRDEVSDTINSWKSQTESRNISAYMNNYADTVDYYNKRGVSASFVRSDKQRAFSRYDNIEIDISNLRITPDASGETATAVFDKEWLFEGENNYSAGKVQSQLQLRKIGGRWKITGERDLKVYYTE